MFSNASRARTWTTRLFRGTAFLLLLTCVDILSPQACAEELFGFPPAAFAEAAQHDSPSPGVAPASSHTGEHSESDHPEEDCFCCCTHLLVRAHFTLETEPPDAIANRPKWLSLPASPPQSLYRPPRAR
jgi:hypothetical protein